MAKPNMTPVKTPMPNQDPAVRAHNFEEVALGYTEEMAHEEATRCLNCKHRPCVSGCPVNVRIPDFIAKVVEGDYEGAYQVITSTNALPAISGRVCPQESQCESKCALWPTGTAPITQTRSLPHPNPTDIRLPWSAPAPPA